MLCRYETTLRALCPVDDSADVYQVTIESPHTIMVEQISPQVRAWSTVKATQESITADLAAKFPGATVTTVGYHSGIRTTVVAP